MNYTIIKLLKRTIGLFLIVNSIFYYSEQKDIKKNSLLGYFGNKLLMSEQSSSSRSEQELTCRVRNLSLTWNLCVSEQALSAFLNAFIVLTDTVVLWFGLGTQRCITRDSGFYLQLNELTFLNCHCYRHFILSIGCFGILNLLFSLSSTYKKQHRSYKYTNKKQWSTPIFLE